MSKIKKENPITNQFLVLKEMYKKGPMDLEKFDDLSSNLIAQLSELTVRGLKEVEGETLDKWKDRVWNLIENAGLLPEYSEEETEELVEILDTWYSTEE
jgi:hypothetical protein